MSAAAASSADGGQVASPATTATATASLDLPATRRPRVVAVVGPTAAGKSDLGLALARALGGEVVNADSMQLYRGMDIGTAKLTEPEWQGIPHHLLDIWPITRAASVADYQSLARAVCDDLLARGVTPVLVGGSGLYVRAVLDDLAFPGTDEQIRARLEAELAAGGSGALHRRLLALDPAAAASILPSNGRRVVRALEVIEITGQPFTANLPSYDGLYDAVQIGIDPPVPELNRRIARRVEVMWERGLVDEVRALAAEGLRDGVTARRALGYQQVLEFLDGTVAEDEARARTVFATRRFARRQMSWFRRDPRIHWVVRSDGGPTGAGGGTGAEPGSAGLGPGAADGADAAALAAAALEVVRRGY